MSVERVLVGGGGRGREGTLLHSTDCAGYKGLKYIWSNGPTDHKPETSQSVELIRESESKIEIEIINKKKSWGLFKEISYHCVNPMKLMGCFVVLRLPVTDTLMMFSLEF